MTRHLTPGEHRTKTAATAAIARAHAHIRPPQLPDDGQRLGELYPYVTPARARQIRLEHEETQC
jgi:hypothetical protein